MTSHDFRLLFSVLSFAVLPAISANAQWSTHYLSGLEKVEVNQWQEAANEFRAAIAIKAVPKRNAVSEVGLIPFDYFPHYQLGRALFFLGDYAAAVENFERELGYAAILESKTDYNNLLRLQETATALLKLRRIETTKIPWTDLLNASASRAESRARKSIDSLLSANPVFDDEGRRQIMRWFAEHPAPVAGTRPSSPALTESDSLALLMQAAQAAYLQGRYFEALQHFERLRQLAPNDAVVAAWQQRVQFEIAQLNAPAAQQTVRSDTITKTEFVRAGSPVLVIREPEAANTSMRAGQLTVRGYAKDDSGIAAIMFAVNGAAIPLPPAEKQALLKPDAEGRYNFSIKIPLRLGENEIVVTAYDLDLEQHASTERLRLRRLPPLYRTAQFWLISSVGLVLVFGALVGNRMIRNRIAFVHHYNPYIAGAPIRTAEMFFGRQQLLERILRTLPNNSLMVYGPRRIGKTSVQHQLLRLLQEREDPVYSFVPVFVDLQGVPEEFFFAHVIEELREQLGAEIAAAVPKPVARAGYGPREFANDLRKLIGLLQAQRRGAWAANKKIRLVLLLDEVDELNRYSERTNQHLRSIFMKSFSENLVAVLTGSNIRKQWESESSPWYNFFEQVALPLLTREETLRLIHEPVKGFFKFDPDAAEKIWLLSDGKPFLVQKFCVRLVNRAIEARRRVIPASEVEAIRLEVGEETA
ncbi:AAA family ATPase [bacterium]|nr:AAA family ATPase [bacterium]